MAEFKSLREIAAESVERYRRKKAGLSAAEAQAFEEAKRRMVQTSIQMEALNARDRDWLGRIGIKI